MPGIVGIVSPGGLAEHRSIIEQMAQPLLFANGSQSDGPFFLPAGLLAPLAAQSVSVQQHAAERFGLASVYSAVSGSAPASCPAPGGRGRIWLAAAGQVIFGNDPNNDAPELLAARLLERFLDSGLNGVCGLNGMYSLAIFEEAEGRVTLVNDRYNASKLFYWHDGRRLMFASEYKAFTWHKDFPRTVDPVTVADLCLHRVPVENRTLFQAARGLPPASILTFADGQLTVRSYWSPVYADPGAPALRDEDYADGMAERMALALRRRARPDTCLLITGGLDSRIVAGLYQKEASTIGLRAASLGRPDGGDVVLGQALAGALGIPHQHIPVGTGYMAQYANPAVWKGEGRNGSYASWIVAAAPYLQSSGTRYVITGLWGNFISARHYPPAFAGVHTLQDGLRVVKEFLHPYSNQTQSLMHPDVFQKYGLESAAALERLFLQPDTSSLVQRYDGFSYLFRISQHGNTEVALGAAAAPLEPYLDNDVFDYAVGVMPPDSRMRGLVNLLLVTRHLPSLANVAMDSSGRSLIDELTTRRSGLRTFIDDTRGRILRRLMPGGHRRYPRAIPHAEALREGSRDFVTAALRQTDLYDDFFDPRAVQSLFESHLAGQGNYFMILDSVLTFILWRKLFCEQTAPATPIMQESRSAMASLEE